MKDSEYTPKEWQERYDSGYERALEIGLTRLSKVWLSVYEVIEEGDTSHPYAQGSVDGYKAAKLQRVLTGKNNV